MEDKKTKGKEPSGAEIVGGFLVSMTVLGLWFTYGIERYDPFAFVHKVYLPREWYDTPRMYFFVPPLIIGLLLLIFGRENDDQIN